MVNASDDARLTDRSPAPGPPGAGGAGPGPATLGHRLRELRLLHRQERLQLVLAALRDRARATEGPGDAHVPEPLAAAITGFQQELDVVRAELRSLGAGVPDAPEGPR